MKIIFWSSFFLVFYTYIGYPLLLYLVQLFSKPAKCQREDRELPKVTILISAYNEEKIVGEKIINALELEYPSDLLEIIAISDGSTDHTDHIIQTFADRGVILKRHDGRIGKTECLNRTIPLTTGEIIVLSDANAFYPKHALRALLACFASEDTGFVTGYTRYTAGGDTGSLSSTGLYTKLEVWTKKLEGALGSCISADGAIFAIRKSLYIPLQDHDINDLVIPFKILSQGYRGLLAQDAFCIENADRSSGDEFARQVRITSRTLRAIFGHCSLINPFKYPLISLELISHKLIRFIVPFLLVFAFVSNVYLVFTQFELLYLVAWLSQMGFYMLATIDPKLLKPNGLLRISEICRTFVMVNWAIVRGWIKYFQSETYTTWKPTR